jgi:predicted GNAT superfamily acetyltransferase
MPGAGEAAPLSAAARDARRIAGDAATRAGVRVAASTQPSDLAVVRDLVDAIWRPAVDDPPVTAGILRALVHAGNYCALAWDGAEPVGACIGFVGLEPPRSLHSHIAGVLGPATGRGVGYALKMDQRAWALEHGLDTVAWTFDPLVRRNAFFNAARLGARPVAYHVDFYGQMHDAINAGQSSDRLEVLWPLADPDVIARAAGTVEDRTSSELLGAGADVVLDVSGEAPVRPPSSGQATVRLVRVPADIEGMRVRAGELAARWRREVRGVLGGLMSEGWQVRTVLREGYYVLERPSDPAARR